MRFVDAKEAIDVRAAGREIGLGPRAAYAAAERGEIPAVRVGARWIVPLVAWNRFKAGDWKPSGDQHEDAAG